MILILCSEADTLMYIPFKNSDKIPNPVCLELEGKHVKLKKLMKDILYIVNADVVVTRTDKGIADLDMNYHLAEELETFGKDLMKMGRTCQERASVLRDKVNRYKAESMDTDKIQFIKQIQSKEVKAVLTKLENPLPVQKDSSKVTWQRKADIDVVYVTDSEDEEADDLADGRTPKKRTVYSGNPDTKFYSPKANNNDPEKFRYKCAGCKKIFKTPQELRNHTANHEEEFYTCLTCFRTFRTYKSFRDHRATHRDGKRYKCNTCGASFERSSTLMNHEQKHSPDYNICRTCKAKFKYRQKYLDHIKYAHLPTKTVKCPMCKHMFQTRGSMATHKWKVHGKAKKLVKGYSLVPRA